MRKYLAVSALALALGLGLPTVSASAQVTNPVKLYGQPMSCPDPDVFNWGRNYAAACTSDFGQKNPDPRTHTMHSSPNAFPIYYSSNLSSWTLGNYIITPHDDASPSFPLKRPRGNWPGGEYWAPEVHKINGWWTAVYGAQNKNGKWVIAQSWSGALMNGNWGTKILYDDPTAGGSIDPSIAPDPQNPGYYDLVFMSFPAQIKIVKLAVTPVIRVIGTPKTISYPTFSWEKNWEEGPVIWRQGPYPYTGVDDLFVNAASTWDNSYAVAIARAQNPLMDVWNKQATPLLQSGNGLVSTGIGAQPFVGPDGSREMTIAFHVQLGQATHNMQGRYLSFGHLAFHQVNGSWWPYVPGGVPPRVYQSVVSAAKAQGVG